MQQSCFIRAHAHIAVLMIVNRKVQMPQQSTMCPLKRFIHYSNLFTFSRAFISQCLFRCVLASLYEGLSVRLSVGPSFRRSVGPLVTRYFRSRENACCRLW